MYYPKSQIKTNLYTNGDEYQNSKGIPYVGYYWKTSSGRIFSGKNPNDSPVIPLFELTSPQQEDSNFNLRINTTSPSPETLSYLNLQNIDPSNPPVYKSPQYSLGIPTEDDYLNGYYLRYFAKVANRNVYIEIDKPTYESLKSGDLNFDFENYKIFRLEWVINGVSEEDVVQTNFDLVEYYEKVLKYPLFTEYFSDYAEFYRA